MHQEMFKGIIIGASIIALGFAYLVAFFGTYPENTAEFVCKSHGLELIDFEIKSPSFSQVECGSPKTIQDENYRVFTND